MKNMIKLFFALTILLFASCKKESDTNDADTNDTEIITGEWSFSSSTSHTVSYPTTSTYTDENTGTIAFNDDGSGKMLGADNSEHLFEWKTIGTDKVQMINLDSNGAPSDTVNWDIIEKSSNSQKWEHVNSYTRIVDGFEQRNDYQAELNLSK
jgi:hypothetical protein